MSLEQEGRSHALGQNPVAWTCLPICLPPFPLHVFVNCPSASGRLARYLLPIVCPPDLAFAHLAFAQLAFAPLAFARLAFAQLAFAQLAFAQREQLCSSVSSSAGGSAVASARYAEGAPEVAWGTVRRGAPSSRGSADRLARPPEGRARASRRARGGR